MTSDVAATATGVPPERLAVFASPRRGWVEHASIVLFLGSWAFPLTHDSGGRGAMTLGWALLAAVPALLAVRPWRTAATASVLAVVVSAAALLVCVFAPTGWAGSDAAAGYVYAALATVIGIGYCRTHGRRIVVAAGLAVAGVDQFLHGAQAWVGGGDATASMVGTFYWHNPFAAFLLVPALLGVVLAASDEQPALRALGFVTAPLAIAGIVLSSSRATVAVLVVAIVLILAAALRAGRRRAGRVVAAMGLAAVVTVALPGPPLFAHWHSPLSATSDRAAAGETVGNNSKFRTEFWREAIDVAGQHPTAGAGYHALATASEYTSPPQWARSSLAHNGYLQAAADGGALLAVPFGAACVAVGVAALLALRRTRLRLTNEVAVPLAAALGTLGLLAHSFVDFDWSHPALFAMTGLAAALAISSTRRERRMRLPSLLAGGVAGTVALLVMSLFSTFAVRAWAHTDRLAHNGAASVAHRPGVLIGRSDGLFGDYRGAAAVLRQAAAGAPVDNGTLRLAWQRTARAAAVDPTLAALRARALVVMGEDARAVRAVDALLERLGPSRTGFVAADAAVTLGMAGDRGHAHALLAPLLASDLAGSRARALWLDVSAAERAGVLTDPGAVRCITDAATRLVGPAPAGLLLPVAAAPASPGGCAARVRTVTR